jgi:hypothetical protein
MIDFKKDPLRFVLNAAYQQAMRGKGAERHADERPFQDQVWRKITDAVGVGFPLGQALKKCDESKRLQREAAIRDLLGAINYTAMAVIALMEGEDGN